MMINFLLKTLEASGTPEKNQEAESEDLASRLVSFTFYCPAAPLLSRTTRRPGMV